ncbi:folate-binding protein, partial [Lysobacter sp. D1-1-M9]|uniref:CAF17-like 4Fe-4S cluster assembly/insertion protein YgfZ n=1 Tax=Novilysobacter longmucuonensis TaxID=3098603 RepID=UPI0032032973
QAFSVKKGCYPGQEIVARTHFLGKAKRGLVLVEGPADMVAGAEVRAGDLGYGTLVAASPCGQRHLGLAVGSTDAALATLAVEGQEVRRLELRRGLAR